MPSKMACMGCMSNMKALSSSSTCTNDCLFCFVLCLEEQEEAAAAGVEDEDEEEEWRGLNMMPFASASNINPFEKVEVALSLNRISRSMDRMSGVLISYAK